MKNIILAISITLMSSAIHAAPINYLEITGGTFSLDGGVNEFEIIPGEFASMTIDGYDPGYRVSVDMTRNVIAYFQFGSFGPMFITTSQDPTLNGSNYRPVTGDITDGNLTLDLDALHIELSLLFSNQGNTDKCANIANYTLNILEEVCTSGQTITTYDSATGEFTASWESLVIDGYFGGGGNIGTWNITGRVSAVPVPAAVWLFGTGLLCLLSFARSNKRLL